MQLFQALPYHTLLAETWPVRWLTSIYRVLVLPEKRETTGRREGNIARPSSPPVVSDISDEEDPVFLSSSYYYHLGVAQALLARRMLPKVKTAS